MNDVRGPEPAHEHSMRRHRVAVVGATAAAWIAALGVALPLMGEPAIQPPLSAFNFLLLALVHLADEPNSILRWPRRLRVTLTVIPLVGATLAGMWLALQWPFDICTALWPMPTDMAPPPACVGAVWLLAFSRLLAERPAWTSWSALIGVAALPPALISIVGWAFGPTLVSTVATPLHLRVPAALAVMAMVMARMASPLQEMPYRWLLGDGPTAIWLRRLLVAFSLLIPSLMLLHDHAVDSNWYQPHAAAMISTVLILTIGLTGLLWSASKLHRAETLLRGAQAELEQRVADRTHELALANQALSRDIAERRRVDEQLRASRERLRAVTVSAIDPILTVNASGLIVQWNQAATQVFGYSEAAILGSALELLLPELKPQDGASNFSTHVAAWLGRTRRCAGRRSSGQDIDMEVSVAMWQDRDERFYSIIGRDVTARTRAELELTEAKNAAEAANRSKSQFLANMSHEIRTPMNVILGMAELIDGTELTADQRRYVTATQEAGDHLLEIINDILDISKVEAGAMQFDAVAFDVRTLAEQTVEFLAPRAFARHLEIVCQLDAALPSAVIGDPQRVRQVLVNLIGNAVKFTDAGHVLLQVEVARPGELRMSVHDTGCGIAPEQHALIFDSFTQVDASSTRRHGGTGLGLAISRQLAERMGGTLTVDSTLNVGSTFTLTLPLRFEPRVPSSSVLIAQANPELDAKLHRCRVVVAGGKPIWRATLAGQVAQLGAVATEIAGMSALLPLLHGAEEAGRPYDLLILDAEMGEIDGYAAAQAVAAEGLRRPPRVAVAIDGDEPADAPRGADTTLAVIMRKPVRRLALRNAVAEALGDQPTAPPIASIQAQELAATPRTLLVVDDAPDNLRLMEAFLRTTGWQVETAEDGAQAVARAEHGVFDAILMDLQMPVMDGLAATRRIRAQEQNAGRAATPIVAVTAHALDEARAESLRAGCNAFLAKPLRRSNLMGVLAELFHGALEAHADGEGPIQVEIDPLLLTLVPGFLEHRREDVATISAALDVGNFATVRLLGHSMKGSGGSYGFDTISRIGRELEVAARDRDERAVRMGVATLTDYLQRLRVR